LPGAFEALGISDHYGHLRVIQDVTHVLTGERWIDAEEGGS
jgi:hypothetical protein